MRMINEVGKSHRTYTSHTHIHIVKWTEEWDTCDMCGITFSTFILFCGEYANYKKIIQILIQILYFDFICYKYFCKFVLNN